MEPARSILLTGASSGIGRALALHYARPGTTLWLSGRDASRLAEVASLCAAKGARAETAVVDVRDFAAVRQWIANAAAVPPDIVIANAGISGGTGGARWPEGERIIFDVNVMGVVNVVERVLPGMIERKSGRIAVMSSVASFSPWPGAPAYAASKAAVRLYGEALAGALKGSGVGIHVICPGFVRTPMTDANDFPMPFMISAGRAAAIIARGMDRGSPRIAFPFPTYMLARSLALLPAALRQKIVSRLPVKKSLDA